MSLLALAPIFRGRAGPVIERNLIVYRRTWLVLLSGVFEPLLYLLGIGFGIGALVGSVPIGGGRTLAYAVFVAPALMASSAMNGAIYDSTFNLFFKLKYAKVYDAMLCTPVSASDVAVGEVAWALFRGTLYAVGFILVMAALGLIQSSWAVLAVPAAMLIGFSFAAAGTAATTFMRSWQDFDLVQLVTLPLFLFSATFFPITAYPAALRFVLEVTPLYHGVDLMRGLTTGDVGIPLLGDVVYLAALGLIGLAVSARRLQILLLR